MFIRPATPIRSMRVVFNTPRVLFASTTTNRPRVKRIGSILIANRGEIALRVSRTALQYGIRTTTVFTDPDAQAAHVLGSHHAVNLGPSNAYLDGEKVITAAKEEGCDSIHPGYGFLSENSHFAQRCAEEGIVFIGPPPKAIESMGNKSESKNIMTGAGVPCVPGYHGQDQDPQYLLEQACNIGFPVLIKAVKGGGGKGMRIANVENEFLDMLQSAKSEAVSSFGDSAVLVESTMPRHIEVQVFADRYGNCVALGERDCSVQRRHQKIVEESPAPNLSPATRKDIWNKAREAALAVGYQGAGTVEFIFDNDNDEFFFMEMNTRLQVEHPITEMVTGVDLVQWQILVASGYPLPLTQQQIEERLDGHAFEARIYAENPDKNFIPDSGKLLHLRTPAISKFVRVDAGFQEGDEITTFYDSMIAKLIVWGADRDEALAKLCSALEEYQIAGPSTNIEFIRRLAEHPSFIRGEVETGFIEKHREKLFSKISTPLEVYAQAALSILLDEGAAYSSNLFGSLGSGVGFARGFQSLQFKFNNPEISEESVSVSVEQCGVNCFNIRMGSVKIPSVKATYLKHSSSLIGFYPRARIESTIVKNGQDLYVFQQGQKFHLNLPQPPWFDKVKGTETNSKRVVAPMPCKVLRVMVEVGSNVIKGQPLVIIESMKMETVIRSPHDGVVNKILRGEGDVVKAGVQLVTFGDAEDA